MASYKLDSSDGKEIEIPEEHRKCKTTEFRLPNGDRIAIEGEKMKIYKPNGREFMFTIPKSFLPEPTLPEPTV